MSLPVVQETWLQTATRHVYSLAMWAAVPLFRRKLAQRGEQEPGYLHAVQERFGQYTQPPEALEGGPKPLSPLIWVHAVSLGETKAASILIANMRRGYWTYGQKPRFLLTHGTATGRAEGETLLQADDVQVWQPWDTPAACAAFFAHFKPQLGVLMETEIWPNLTHAAHLRGMPLVLANARMSDKTARQSHRLAWLARPAFAKLSAVYAQTQADAARLVGLGAAVKGVFGNLKFDVQPNAEQLATGREWRSNCELPVVALAVSREGEEKLFLDAFCQFVQHPRHLLAAKKVANDNQESAPNPWPFQPLIVPRHPQRFDEVAALIESMGFQVSRRSAWAGGPPPAGAADPAAQPSIWLGDTLGDMPLYYGLSTVALLGGSFAPLGGQNLIEAAACACPVVCGPSTFNFADAAEQAVAAGAALRAPDLAAAVQAAQATAGNPRVLAAMQNAAQGFTAAHAGAAQRTTAALLAGFS